MLRQPPPIEVQVLVDAGHGFLHRMNGLVGHHPLVIEELVDLVLDPPLDDSTFRIDESRVRVPEQSD